MCMQQRRADTLSLGLLNAGTCTWTPTRTPHSCSETQPPGNWQLRDSAQAWAGMGAERVRVLCEE